MMSWLESSYESKSQVLKVFRPRWTSPFISCCCNFLILARHPSIPSLSLSHFSWSSNIRLSQVSTILMCVSCITKGSCAMFVLLDSCFRYSKFFLPCIIHNVTYNSCAMDFNFALCCYCFIFVAFYCHSNINCHLCSYGNLSFRCGASIFKLEAFFDFTIKMHPQTLPARPSGGYHWIQRQILR